MIWLWILEEVFGIFYHNGRTQRSNQLAEPEEDINKAPVKDVKEADGKDILA